MKLFFLALIILEFCLLMIAISRVSPFIDLNPTVRAYDAWQKNPTTENEARWLREKASLQRKQLFENICIYTFLAVNSAGLIALLRKFGKQKKLHV